MNSCACACFAAANDFRLGRSRTAQFDVAADGFVEQQRLLRYHADLLLRFY